MIEPWAAVETALAVQARYRDESKFGIQPEPQPAPEDDFSTGDWWCLSGFLGYTLLVTTLMAWKIRYNHY